MKIQEIVEHNLEIACMIAIKTFLLLSYKQFLDYVQRFLGFSSFLVYGNRFRLYFKKIIEIIADLFYQLGYIECLNKQL